MDHYEVTYYCLTKPGAVRDEPWEDDPVAKVGGKIFAFLGGGRLGVKCGTTAEEAAEWRQLYPDSISVMPYIGRYGWNTVKLDATVPDEEIIELIDASYDDVVSRLPKSKRPTAS
ncbi:MAG: MmcQ/YjbR family DNA-binding protein [Pseudonocardiaceae bacterium]